MKRMSPEEAARRVMPLSNWPEADRTAWERSLPRSQGPFRKNGGGPTIGHHSLLNRKKGYGRWLGFLRQVDELDLNAMPSARVTPERLDAYIEDLRCHGNRPSSIVNRIVFLKGALKTMEPDDDHEWITRPCGVPIQRYFDAQPRDRPVHHSATLLAWAEEQFAAGLAHPLPHRRCPLIRDAAIVAVFVLPAPRVGALSQLRLGINLQRRDQGWWLDQDASITKMSRAEWCPLPEAVTPILDRYLAVERVELLQGRLTDRLWIAWGGADLTKSSIRNNIRKRSGISFDQAFGPHAFRRALGTTVAVDGYDSPHDASVLLGHTNSETTTKHYNMAKTFATAERQAERMERMLRQAQRDACR